ncbi:MAG: TolC family protein, partial [Vicinamibacteria bacterium]
ATSDPDVVRLTLAETVERARAASAHLLELDALATAADAGIRGAKAGRLPQVDVAGVYAHSTNFPTLTLTQPGTETREIALNYPDNYRARATLSLPVYTGGRVEGGIEAARRNREAAGSDLEGGIQDLVLEASTAYWQLVTARENVRVLAESVASFEAHLKDTRARQDLGMAANNEVLAVQVQRDRAELRRLAAANGAAIANANLGRLVGLPAGARIEPTERSGAEGASPFDVETLVSDALRARPEAGSLRSRIASLDASVRVARASRRPQAAVSAGYDYAWPNATIVPPPKEWKSTWNVGAALSITAFDGGRSAASAAQAGAQAEALRHRLEDLERHIRLEVTSRVLDLGTARAVLAVADRNVEAALENVRVAQDRYREGVIPSSELLDAETARLMAGLDHTAAVSDLHQAEANLRRALGSRQ